MKTAYLNRFPRLPIQSTIMVSFLLYYFCANGILTGIFAGVVITIIAFFMLIWWVGAINVIRNSKEISTDELLDLIDKAMQDDVSIPKTKSSKFQQNLNKLAAEKGIKLK